MKPPYQLTFRFLDTSVCTIGNRTQSHEHPLTKQSGQRSRISFWYWAERRTSLE